MLGRFCPSVLENHLLSSALLSEHEDEVASISAARGTARMSCLNSSEASLSRLRKR